MSEMMRLASLRIVTLAGACLGVGYAPPAWADDPPPVVSVAIRNTLDAWTILQGERSQPVVLDRLQVSGTIAFDRIGVDGLSIHAQVFRFSGSSLSERIGDVQTADAIDTLPVTRLFEAWVEKKWGTRDRSVAVRLGLMDLNADFDSIAAGSLFINSSHGVGADLARSGLNGPSIYPVSALGARLNVAPSKRFAIRYALLDGVAGDSARPRAFVIARLAPRDGTLSIGQMDWRPSEQIHLALGAWRYSRSAPTLDGRGRGFRQGLFVEVEKSLTRRLGAWVRVGADDSAVEPVSGYLGAGFVLKNPFAGRSDDSVGLAVARAFNSSEARRLKGVEAAETGLELTYRLAGAAGFEPAYDGTKNRCLTAWRRPSIRGGGAP